MRHRADISTVETAGAGGRVVRLAGASNFRDLGGYGTREGRTVRWRRVFRSDRLDLLDEADWHKVAGLGIDTVVDFRSPEEAGQASSRQPLRRFVALPIAPDLDRRLETLRTIGERLDAARMRSLMQQEYRRILIDHAKTFGEFLHTLAEADGAVVFHCAAGKDRTGIAAALLLATLGVGRATIEQDYLLTNDLYQRPGDLRARHLSGMSREALEVMWSVHASHLNAAFDALDEVHGGLEPFLAGPVGLSQALRRRLVDNLLEG